MSFTARLSALDAHIDGLARLSEADAQKSYLNAHNKLATVVTLIGSVTIPVTVATEAFQLLELPVTPISISGLLLSICLSGGLTRAWLNRMLPKAARRPLKVPSSDQQSGSQPRCSRASRVVGSGAPVGRD